MSPPGRSPRLMLFGLALALLAVNVTVVLTVRHLESRLGGGDIAVADRFMKAIEIGSGADPEGARGSGYEAAWALLSEDCRRGRPFPEFLAFFEARVTDHGFIESWRRSPEEAGGMGDRRLVYLVDYGDLDLNRTTVRYELRLVQRDEGHEIVAYTAEVVPAEGGR